IFLLVISLNLLGDGVRDVLDPRLRSGELARPGAMTAIAKNRTAPPLEDTGQALSIAGLETGFLNGGQFSPAVRNISLQLQRGECLGLIGESGSGKSVTALSIMGLVASPPGLIRNGAIYLGDRDVLAMSETELTAARGARVAYVFQDPLTTLHPMYPIGRQVEEAIAAHRRIGASERREQAIALLDKVGIPDAAERVNHYPHQLSGGQRQRVGIAMALSNDPEIIIADEPTTALDVTVQARILELLRDLQREKAMALLFITHDFGVVSEICDRVAVMKDGEIVETRTPRELLSDHLHGYTQRLTACVLELVTGDGFLDRVAGRLARHGKEAAS